MYRIEKEMLENFYSSKKPLQKGKNIIISDINNKIFSIVNNLEKEYSIPKSIFFTYFNLHIPQLELSDIYKWINRTNYYKINILYESEFFTTFTLVIMVKGNCL